MTADEDLIVAAVVVVDNNVMVEFVGNTSVDSDSS